MAVDYNTFTDVFQTKNDSTILRDYPEAGALALAVLKRGQKLRRLDTNYWNGAWLRFYADVPGMAKYEGYLRFEEVEGAVEDAPAQPAPQPPTQDAAPPQQPTQPPPQQQPQPPAQTPPVAQQPTVAEPPATQQPGPPPPQSQQPPAAPIPAPTPAPQAGGATAPTLALGCVDAGVTDQAWAAYQDLVLRTTSLRGTEAKAPVEKLPDHKPPPAGGPVTVAQIQQGLKAWGFFPGGRVDGIYGYRTRSAVRLFQEYVRSVKKYSSTPDGRVGPETLANLQRWASSNEQMNWSPHADESDKWLALLQAVKQKYLAAPTRTLAMVNANTKPTDTRKVTDWDFTGPGHIHLIGVRRPAFRDKFEDIFVLLVKGLVFKFQGTTETWYVEEEHKQDGAPYLTPGQHDYRFGWHHGSYLALRPKHFDVRDHGVLVVRTGRENKFDEADLDRGLETNSTINIHWGGPGMDGKVKNWSAGCQVIGGTVYIKPSGELESCAGFAATSSAAAQQDYGKTRGAYNLLSDLVAAYASDLQDDTVKYTLLMEEDLDLAPELKQMLADARESVLRLIETQRR